MSNPINTVRLHTTPIPTPAPVRVGGSILVATAVAALASDLSVGIGVAVAAVCMIAAIVLVFAHPYRRELRAFADKHNVTMMPTVAQLMPLMMLWLLLMFAPLFILPLWATALLWLGMFAAAMLLFPHIDGTRKMAYAQEARLT